MPEESHDRERVPLAGQVTGEIMVFQPMTILDISHGGAQIETPFPLQVDSLHDIRLSLGDRSVVVKARIAHCHVGELTESSALYRTGIEFIEPTAHVRDAIATFLEAVRTAGERSHVVDGEMTEENPSS